MKILITGAKGFIGRNLVAELRNRGYQNIFEYDIDTSNLLFDEYIQECEFVFHLAGINRPINENEFMEGNYEFTVKLLNKLKEYENKAPILLTSSIQAILNNPYGKSKKAGEDVLFKYQSEIGNKILIYRLPNVFGKWCKPNYNSVIATFCNNIANNIDIEISDTYTVMNLVYIDDVINEFINALHGKENRKDTFCYVPIMYSETLGNIAKLLSSFKESRNNLTIFDMSNDFVKKLYSTYLTYLPKDQLCYPLKMNIDERGSFSEFIRTQDRGQVSINIIKPGITKGNHWHHTKNEKFLVVQGKSLIQLRNINDDDIIDYHVSGDVLQVIDIPPGYTHLIRNEGIIDLVAIIWASEEFNSDKPDTFLLNV
jgi:UDP-2-acetamido-2,6-beta-L-arabino-hexul-4-ose reductase